MEFFRSIVLYWVRFLFVGRYFLCFFCILIDIVYVVRCFFFCWRLILEMGTVDFFGKAGFLFRLYLELCVFLVGVCGDFKNRGVREGGRWAFRLGGGRCGYVDVFVRVGVCFWE